jgi:hypothetical protein
VSLAAKQESAVASPPATVDSRSPSATPASNNAGSADGLSNFSDADLTGEFEVESVCETDAEVAVRTGPPEAASASSALFQGARHVEV